MLYQIHQRLKNDTLVFRRENSVASAAGDSRFPLSLEFALCALVALALVQNPEASFGLRLSAFDRYCWYIISPLRIVLLEVLITRATYGLLETPLQNKVNP